MGTEVTFRGGVVVGIDVEGVVGAGLHASFAPDTSRVVEVHDSIMPAVERVGRTNLDARSIVAVVTSQHAEMAAGVREFALLDIFHPRAKHAHRHLMLFFTRNGTCVTANTSVVINNKSVAHER